MDRASRETGWGTRSVVLLCPTFHASISSNARPLCAPHTNLHTQAYIRRPRKRKEIIVEVRAGYIIRISKRKSTLKYPYVLLHLICMSSPMQNCLEKSLVADAAWRAQRAFRTQTQTRTRPKAQAQPQYDQVIIMMIDSMHTRRMTHVMGWDAIRRHDDMVMIWCCVRAENSLDGSGKAICSDIVILHAILRSM